MNPPAIHPFGYRVAVRIAEEDSGLVIIRHDDGLQRGVIIEVGDSDPDDDITYPELQPGNVVHFTRGTRVGDVFIVDMADIIAYEKLNESEEDVSWPLRQEM